ncbi:MAG: hypothetical protein GY861_07245 [bacterium]|nr:hypothetical protein [bacterium]
MKVFRDVVKEITIELDKIMIFDVLLNTILVFLIFYFALSFFRIAWYSFVITAVYLIVALLVKLTHHKLFIVEEKCPELREKLRTASDNIRLENPVVNELHSEVMNDMKNVQESVFFSDKETYLKSFVVLILCFLIVFFAPIYSKWNIMPAGDIIETIKTDGVGALMESDESEYDPMGAGGYELSGTAKIAGDIYGAESIALLGEEEISLEVRPSGYEINIRDIKEVEERDFTDTYPKEVFAVSAEAYEENIPVEEQDLVKNYFKELAS